MSCSCNSRTPKVLGDVGSSIVRGYDSIVKAPQGHMEEAQSAPSTKTIWGSEQCGLHRHCSPSEAPVSFCPPSPSRPLPEHTRPTHPPFPASPPRPALFLTTRPEHTLPFRIPLSPLSSLSSACSRSGIPTPSHHALPNPHTLRTPLPFSSPAWFRIPVTLTSHVALPGLSVDLCKALCEVQCSVASPRTPQYDTRALYHDLLTQHVAA